MLFYLINQYQKNLVSDGYFIIILIDFLEYLVMVEEERERLDIKDKKEVEDDMMLENWQYFCRNR